MAGHASRIPVTMLYGILADIVISVHLLWILFLIAGAYWGREHRPVMWFHGGGLAFAMISQVFGWYCPLTHLEVWLREKQNILLTYPGSFISHYTEKLIYVEMSGAIIFALTLVLIGINAWIYWKAYWKGNHPTLSSP